MTKYVLLFVPLIIFMAVINIYKTLPVKNDGLSDERQRLGALCQLLKDGQISRAEVFWNDFTIECFDSFDSVTLFFQSPIAVLSTKEEMQSLADELSGIRFVPTDYDPHVRAGIRFYNRDGSINMTMAVGVGDIGTIDRQSVHYNGRLANSLWRISRKVSHRPLLLETRNYFEIYGARVANVFQGR